MPATIRVELGAPAKAAVTVAYRTEDGSAVAGKDYKPTSGTLTFAPGEKAKSFTVMAANGKLGKGKVKTVNLHLSKPTNSVLDAPFTATLNIAAATASARHLARLRGPDEGTERDVGAKRAHLRERLRPVGSGPVADHRIDGVDDELGGKFAG